MARKMARGPDEIYRFFAFILTVQGTSLVFGQTTGIGKVMPTNNPDTTSMTSYQSKLATTPVNTKQVNTDSTRIIPAVPTTIPDTTSTVTTDYIVRTSTAGDAGSSTKRPSTLELKRKPDIRTTTKINETNDSATTVGIVDVPTKNSSSAGIAVGVIVAFILSFILIGVSLFFYRRYLKHRVKSSPNDVNNRNNVDVVYENDTPSYEKDTVYENGTTLYENTSSRSNKHVYQNQVLRPAQKKKAEYHYDYAEPIQTQSNMRQKGSNGVIKMTQIDRSRGMKR